MQTHSHHPTTATAAAPFVVLTIDLSTGAQETRFASDDRDDCEIWAAAYLKYDTRKAVAIVPADEASGEPSADEGE